MRFLKRSSRLVQKTLAALLWTMILGALPNAASADITLYDDTGTPLVLTKPARRIITLAPHLSENVFAAGAGAFLIATVSFSDFPEATKSLPQIGSYAQLDLEAIGALKPDLILAWKEGNSPAHLEKLRKMGVPIYISQMEKIEDIPRIIDVIGKLADTTKTAEQTSQQLRSTLESLRKRYSTRPKIRVFYQIWNEPLLSVGGKQIISHAISLCGGDNIFERQSALAPRVSREAVLAANPEVIIASGMDDHRPQWLDDWKHWKTLSAIKYNNIFFIPPDIIQRHTPRFMAGLEHLCKALETAREHRHQAEHQ